MNIKSIHFVGIKGVGMTPLAIIAKEAGFAVTGSDVDEAFITDESLEAVGIVSYKGFSSNHVTNQDLVITTGAHGGFFNPEVTAAKNKGIPFMSQGQAVGEFMKGSIFNKTYQGISVAGTHGKTTTSAMLATIFADSGLDPAYAIGTSTVPSLGLSGHFGNGNYFVAEADEYISEQKFERKAKFLWQHPKIAVFTTIEFDHPDVYNSIDEIRNTYLQFAKQLPKDGLLIACGDDEQVMKLLQEYIGNVVTYGRSLHNDFVVKNIDISDLTTSFTIEANGVIIGEFSINVSGIHNALNASAAILAAKECGVNPEISRTALQKFSGSKRRFEYIGKLPHGALVFDDYAHHPTEIKKTLQAFRQSFPGKRIICIFQPHTFSRTQQLFEEFTRAFSDANLVLLSDIYASAREEQNNDVSSKHLTLAMRKLQDNIVYLPERENMVKYIAQQAYGDDTVVITMGAGDIYKIKDALHVS